MCGGCNDGANGGSVYDSCETLNWSTKNWEDFLAPNMKKNRCAGSSTQVIQAEVEDGFRKTGKPEFRKMSQKYFPEKDFHFPVFRTQ